MRKVPLIREITLAVMNYRSVLLQKSDITNMDIIHGNSDFTVLTNSLTYHVPAKLFLKT